MEQLTDPIFTLEAFVVDEHGGRSPFSLIVSRADVDDLGEFCWVHCPHIRDRNMKIYGSDAEHALACCHLFVESYLKYGNEYLVDVNGLRIDLPPYEYEATEP